jgi:hypothetical protein
MPQVCLLVILAIAGKYLLSGHPDPVVLMWSAVGLLAYAGYRWRAARR